MRICYINFTLSNPRDQITLRGLKENGVQVTELTDNSAGWRKYFNIAKKYRQHKKDYDLVMIGYTGSALVVFMRLITTQKIVYNALATFYDSMIVSRFGGSFFSFSAAWHFLIDFFAFRFATISFLECQSQKDLVVKVFKVKPSKISVQYVGTDDREFYFDPAVKKLDDFTVVFRGAFLPEAGADVVIRAAKELEGKGVNFRILGRGLLQKQMEALIAELKPTNLDFETAKLPIDELRRKMLECHISLGQLADHPRVHTTIPHKVFESMSMKLPYLTGENKGVMEVVHDGVECFTVPPGDHKALAQKIFELKNQQEKINQVAQNAYVLYKNEFTPKILAEKVLKRIATE